MKRVLRIAIRALAEQTMRSGSLGGTFIGASRASQDSSLYRKIQPTRPAGYRAEVPIIHRIDTPNFELELSGRIDGVLESDGRTIVEEMKITTLTPAELSSFSNPMHWAQLKLYAYCYAVQNTLDRITAQLTYYNLDTGKEHKILQPCSLQELTVFFQELITRYIDWANTLEDWRRLRDESIHALAFPFDEYRAGQREMAVEVYLAMKQRAHLLIQAPTGIGKTIATLFPTIKALGEGHVEKIFYLTARNTGKTAAEDALTRLRQRGLRFKAVTLTAKERVCLAPQICCQPELCEFAEGYFDRIGRAMREAFESDALTREIIAGVARHHHICPFELSLDLSLWADGIVCDYNYAFDPRVYLKRFFQEVSGSYAFLIDEAHNLVDRAREMFSAELGKQEFGDLRREIKPCLPKLYRKMGKIAAWFRQTGKNCEAHGKPYAEAIVPEDLLPPLRTFVREVEEWLARNLPTPFRSNMLELFFKVKWFLIVAEKFDECYTTCFDSDNHNVRVKLFCLDPSRQMQEVLQRSQAAVFFSATLTPPAYFQRLFGCQPDARKRAFLSPFPPEHLCLLIMPTISTRYQHRATTVQAVVHAMLELIQPKQGNYLLFFPSYQYMQVAYEAFLACLPNVDTLLQAPAMSEEDRAAFLGRFAHDNQRTLVGFAVMGGIFGEGIDLVGDRLTGAVIVGVGLPAVGLERELIRKYFNRTEDAGFEFAYLYPGLIRVLQAAGRVIRTETDRGVVLLIDERFADLRYRTLFPKEWQPVRIESPVQLRERLKRFWLSEILPIR